MGSPLNLILIIRFGVIMKLMKFTILIDGQSIEIVANVRDSGENLIFLVHGLGCSKDSFHHLWNRNDFDDYFCFGPGSCRVW
jgi:hypothetical protein